MPYTGSIRRPTSLAEMDERFQHMGTEEGRQAGLSFQPQPTDIIISPFAKSGTTWLQQTVHGLRTRGDMDFDDISRVVPWLETSTDLGIDLQARQRGHPRAFKSHLSWHDVPKGARYIVSIRDPKDAAVSIYHFMEGWYFEPGAISRTDFLRARFLSDAPHGYWDHLLSWWEQRHSPDVLLLSYEAMQADFPSALHRIAAFIGVALDPELEQLVLRQSAFDFMLAHKDKFDDKLMRQRSERLAGLPPGSDSAKVRRGMVGAHQIELPGDISADFDAIWRAEITPKLGFSSYQELQAELATLYPQTPT